MLVTLFKRISTNAYDHVIVRKEVDLPFFPFPGLYITNYDTHEQVEKVFYSTDNKTITCYVAPDNEWQDYALRGMKQRSVDTIVGSWTALGWNLVE